jgi:hypothetical protein
MRTVLSIFAARTGGGRVDREGARGTIEIRTSGMGGIDERAPAGSAGGIEE